MSVLSSWIRFIWWAWFRGYYLLSRINWHIAVVYWDLTGGYFNWGIIIICIPSFAKTGSSTGSISNLCIHQEKIEVVFVHRSKATQYWLYYLPEQCNKLSWILQGVNPLHTSWDSIPESMTSSKTKSHTSPAKVCNLVYYPTWLHSNQLDSS